ncbi:hypothetical protein PCANC_28685, partial [Puccinia coronata f. sp. avenae]
NASRPTNVNVPTTTSYYGQSNLLQQNSWANANQGIMSGLTTLSYQSNSTSGGANMPPNVNEPVSLVTQNTNSMRGYFPNSNCINTGIPIGHSTQPCYQQWISSNQVSSPQFHSSFKEFQIFYVVTLPEKLARIVASEFISDVAIRFKLRQGATKLIVDRVKLCGLGVLPPDLDRSSIHSVARRPILNRMAASDVNSGATIQASIAGSVTSLHPT